MQGVGEPHLLIDGGASPHTYAMKPSEVRRLNRAGVVIRVSNQLETFLEKPLAATAGQSRVVTLDRETPGLTLHDVRKSGDFEPHAHGTEHGAHAHGHRHQPAKTHASDTHIWLDPRNAKAIVQHVADVLAERYPDSAARFAENAQALGARLDRLDANLAARLAPVAGRPFLVFHDAYQYLERRYGLSGVGSVTVSPEVPPSARRISELRARVAKDRIACVFAEPQFTPRVITAIAEGTRVRQGMLDPLGAGLPPGPDQYFSTMEALAAHLAGCLAASDRASVLGSAKQNAAP
jgi:zinc transport system substrate-binding protein